MCTLCADADRGITRWGQGVSGLDEVEKRTIREEIKEDRHSKSTWSDLGFKRDAYLER